jgi:hypothetical protein
VVISVPLQSCPPAAHAAAGIGVGAVASDVALLAALQGFMQRLLTTIKGHGGWSVLAGKTVPLAMPVSMASFTTL